MSYMPHVDHEKIEAPDGFGDITMNEPLTMPENMQYRRGFNAGWRNRTLAMHLAESGAFVHVAEAYRTGYANGWREADAKIMANDLCYHPCAVTRGKRMDSARRTAAFMTEAYG